MNSESSRKQTKKTQKVYSVRISNPGSKFGKYLRFRSKTDSHGNIFLSEDFVGNMDDASRYIRFEDAKEKAFEEKEKNPSLEVSVVEILGRILGRSHLVKSSRKERSCGEET